MLTPRLHEKEEEGNVLRVHLSESIWDRDASHSFTPSLGMAMGERQRRVACPRVAWLDVASLESTREKQETQNLVDLIDLEKVLGKGKKE